MAHIIDTFPTRHLPRGMARRRRRLAHPPAACTLPAPRYDRHLELARILPLWPHELADLSPQGRRKVLCKLTTALRAERRRGIAGHWTYDLARHVELLRVYRLELAASRHAQVFSRGRE